MQQNIINPYLFFLALKMQPLQVAGLASRASMTLFVYPGAPWEFDCN